MLFACDFKQVVKTTPVQPIQNIVYETKAHLHILHVIEDAKKDTDHEAEIETLTNLFQGLSPQFHLVESSDFAETINTFTDQNNIDLVVAIPRKHGFFEGLFHKSHIKMLAFHTHTPLLLMHEV